MLRLLAFVAIAATPDRHFYPATSAAGTPVTKLPEAQRHVVERVQAVLKPRYRNTLRYTYSGAGDFVLVPWPYTVPINACHSPPDPKCIHDCGLALNQQFWQLMPIMEFGRCQDALPIWLHPKQRLPVLEDPGGD